MADFQLHKLPMAKHLLKQQQREAMLAAAQLLLRQPGLGDPPAIKRPPSTSRAPLGRRRDF